MLTSNKERAVTKMSIKYRLYTQDLNRSDVVHLTAQRFDGATFTSGQGLWQGNEEATLIVEVIRADERDAEIDALARDVKRANKQASVLITKESIDASFV